VIFIFIFFVFNSLFDYFLSFSLIAILNGLRVAVKEPLQGNSFGGKPTKELLSEVETLKFVSFLINFVFIFLFLFRKIFHPNIVLFLGVTQIGNRVGLVTERLAGDLFTLVQCKKKLSGALQQRASSIGMIRKLVMLRDAALGFSWLHNELDVVHRDIKPQNILVDEELRVKISDFGISANAQEGFTQAAGTCILFLFLL